MGYRMPVAIHSLSLKPQVVSSYCFCRMKMDVLSYRKVRTKANRSCRTTSTTTSGGGARLLHAMVD